MLSEAKHLCFFLRLLSNPEIDSFVSRLSRCYPRSATVYVARPTRSILRFAQNDRSGKHEIIRSLHLLQCTSSNQAAGYL